MKPTTALLLLNYFVVIGLTSCKNATQKVSKTHQIQEVVEDTILSQENEIPIYFDSALRPSENLLLNKTYLDTVTFIEFNNYDFDEVLFSVKNKKDTIYLVSEDIWEGKFLTGDKIAITWKMDSLRPAGDPESIIFTEYLVAVNKIKNVMPTQTNLPVLWRENLYNEQLKTDVSTLVFNTAYLQTLSQQEKAALGYITTFIGNECEWDGGKPNEDRSNLDCQFLSALNLGYQCSNEHLGFLKHWFSQDFQTLEKLESCPTLPNTATLQSTFNDISIEVREEEHLIIIQYNYQTINLREGTVVDRFKTAKFEYTCESIILLSS